MRYEKGHKQATRNRIIETAAARFEHWAENVDPATIRWQEAPELLAVAQVADLIDPAIARSVDLENVERRTVQNRDAVLARVVGCRSRPVNALDAARQDFRGRRFSRTARPGEQIGVRELAALDRAGQGSDDGVLADEVCKRLGAPGTVKGHVR